MGNIFIFHFLIVQIAILWFLIGASCDPNEIQAYKTLIQNNVGQAQTYNLTQRNVRFEAGAASQTINDWPEEFDFIIVGGGTAGCVLATRLSENPKFSILLLEAGSEETIFSKIPNMAIYSQFSPMNWGFYTTPQNNCCKGMVDQQCMAARGQVLGGSSSISFSIYRRAARRSFQEWHEIGWSFLEALKYYIKSENSQVDGDADYHGKGGLLNVENPKPDSQFQPDVIKGNAEVGIPFDDYNGRRSVGVSKPQVTIKHGSIQSTSTAFLDYGRARGNLRVITDALVVEILTNTRSDKAQGVLFIKDGKKFRVNATKEVILSAGPFNTPQLLMLSGIGPKEHLNEKNITVKQDLPVGKLEEKPLFPGLVVRTNTTIIPQSNLDILIQQYLSGYGPLTKPLYIDLLDLIPLQGAPSDTPMFQCLFIPPGRGQPTILQRVFNYDSNITENFLNKINVTTDMVFHLILDRPESRGRVTLKSSDPLDFPNIDFNYFSDPRDIQNYIKGIKFILDKLIKTEALQEVEATPVLFDICEGNEKGSDSYWECVIRTLTVTAYEPSGTASAGTNRRNSVVDKDLRVHGIRNLRVVDASVFSSHIAGQADTIMAAEKIADVIKLDYINILTLLGK